MDHPTSHPFSSADASPDDLPPSFKALEGVRVFDLTIVTAGAGCTQVLADHGADVIKIESPRRPDLFRQWTSTSAGENGDLDSPPFRTVNRNKRGFAVDLKQPDGLEIARKLIAGCDVVVENFRQGVMDRLGLGFRQLVEMRSNIVLVSMSSQGTDGPNVGYGSYGSSLDALGGTMSITGYDEDNPLWSSNKVNYPDQAAALLGPALIVFAVLAARASGGPRWIDVSQREMVTDLVGEEILRRSLGGTDPVPTANSGSVGYEWATPCSGENEWLAISVLSDADQIEVAAVVGRPELATASRSELRDGVAAWSGQLDKAQAARRLQASHIAATPVMKGYELYGDPYFEALDFFRSVPLPRGGTELQRGPIVRFDDADAAAREYRRAPHVGENTSEIMTNDLGKSAEELLGLLDSGVISQSPD